MMRGWLERLLLWYDPDREAQRDRATERVVRRSVVARARAERAIAAYRQADSEHRRTGVALTDASERIIDEIDRE